MKLTKWTYSRRYNIKAVYDKFPNSNVIFRIINQFYFIYIVNWSEKDPLVTRRDLEEMELLLNREMGTSFFYRRRKSRTESGNIEESERRKLQLKKSMIIVNPASGKEEAEVYVEKVQQQLRGMEYEADVWFTEKEGDATVFAAEACANKYDVVISIGGDGTLNEIINGLAEKEHRPALGIVPLGTVNDFARALHIPLEAEEAIAAIGKGHVEKADIGKINDRYFLNIAALGDIAESTAGVSSGQKTAIGALAYFLEGAKTLVNKKSFDLQVQTNDQQYKEEALLFLAALTNSVGGFEKMAPEAEVNDGKLHCFIIKDTVLPKLVRIAANLLKGEIKADPDVLYFRANQLTVSSSQPLKANVDGDAGERVPLTLQVLKEHIDVMVP